MQTPDGIHKFYEGDVQYPFADVGTPELLHISDVTQENRKTFTYTCPYCRKELLPRLGRKKAHCFAHKPGNSCELDRYIHKTAILLLKEKWERNEPFVISMKVRTECKNLKSCPFYKEYGYGCISKEVITYDLKKQFTQCIVEKKFGEFIPDLCLVDYMGRHEPIFIEIWSKHKNSEKKANSEYRIIEIRLKTLKDLEELPKHPITESESVTFSHFRTLVKTPSGDDGPNLMRYTLYADTLKSHVDTQYCHCWNYREKHHSRSIFEVVCNNDEIPLKKFHNYCNAIAIDKGFNIRNCFLCQLFGNDNRDPNTDKDFNNNLPSGCRRKLDTHGLISCKPDDAMTCQHFRLKDSQLNSLKGQYYNINRYIWSKNNDGSVSEEIQKHKDYRDFDKPDIFDGFQDIARYDWI